MNTYGGSTTTIHRVDHDRGFTLIEILIAIVLIGVLSAVAVVGIGNMLSTGSKSACEASKDASKAASSVYFASHSNAYPVSFTQLTDATAGPAALALPTGVVANAAAITGPPAIAIGMQVSSGTAWYMTMTPGVGTAAPTFVCT